MRWSADVNVWTSSRARNRRAKRRIRNAVALEKIQERQAFGTIRMKRNVHRVAVVQPPAIMYCALAKNGNRQVVMKRVGKESLHLSGLTQVPTWTTSETNE